MGNTIIFERKAYRVPGVPPDDDMYILLGREGDDEVHEPRTTKSKGRYRIAKGPWSPVAIGDGVFAMLEALRMAVDAELGNIRYPGCTEPITPERFIRGWRKRVDEAKTVFKALEDGFEIIPRIVLGDADPDFTLKAGYTPTKLREGIISGNILGWRINPCEADTDDYGFKGWETLFEKRFNMSSDEQRREWMALVRRWAPRRPGLGPYLKVGGFYADLPLFSAK